jgi:prepilin-type N-terminal cleavage/methylation domain-containing protein
MRKSITQFHRHMILSHMNGPSTKRQEALLHPKQIRSQGAFTLVELLTVIAIVAVLASLFLTAVVSAKKKSRTVVCTFNLRQISLALNMYMDDFGKRPSTVDNLVADKYLTERRSLLCPEDKTGNWGRLVQSAGSIPDFPGTSGNGPGSVPSGVFVNSIKFSYLLHPLRWDERTWLRLMQEGGSAGVAACQLHGLGKQNVPSVRSFEGLLLRAQRDGAVVRRHLFWHASLPGGDSTDILNNPGGDVSDQYPFQIYLDAPPDWRQIGPGPNP